MRGLAIFALGVIIAAEVVYPSYRERFTRWREQRYITKKLKELFDKPSDMPKQYSLFSNDPKSTKVIFSYIVNFDGKDEAKKALRQETERAWEKAGIDPQPAYIIDWEKHTVEHLV